MRVLSPMWLFVLGETLALYLGEGVGDSCAAVGVVHFMRNSIAVQHIVMSIVI